MVVFPCMSFYNSTNLFNPKALEPCRVFGNCGGPYLSEFGESAFRACSSLTVTWGPEARVSIETCQSGYFHVDSRFSDEAAGPLQRGRPFSQHGMGLSRGSVS